MNLNGLASSVINAGVLGATLITVYAYSGQNNESGRVKAAYHPRFDLYAHVQHSVSIFETPRMFEQNTEYVYFWIKADADKLEKICIPGKTFIKWRDAFWVVNRVKDRYFTSTGCEKPLETLTDTHAKKKPQNLQRHLQEGWVCVEGVLRVDELPL